MSFTEAFSPPIVVNLPDGRTASFRRVLMDDWAAVCETIKADRIAASNIAIGTDKTMTPDAKLLARRRAQAEDVDIYDALRHCTRTVAGIRLLLSKMLVGTDVKIADVYAMTAPTDLATLADAIAYAPIVWPETNAPLAESGGAAIGNSTQTDSASEASPPADSPSDSSSTSSTEV